MYKSDLEGDSSRPKGAPHRSKAAPQRTPYLFEAWVKDRCKALDLPQQDLAERAACAAVTITRVERGALRPSQQLAAMLADALRIPPTERFEFLRLARAALGEERWQAAWVRGYRLSMKDEGQNRRWRRRYIPQRRALASNR